MRKISTIFLQVVIVLIGIVALVMLLREPWIEGVNTNATTLSQIYFDDPFLLLVYIGSISLFVAFYQAFKLLGYIRKNKAFSAEAVKTLQTIQYCALAVIGFVAVEEIIIILNHGSDDPVGAVAMGIFITFGSLVVAAVAAIWRGILQSPVTVK